MPSMINPTTRTRILQLLSGAAAVMTLAGCVVAPLPPPRPVVYGPPPGVAYIAPTYAVPGPGYVWEYHAQYGWGYRHPQYGWHRGWR